MGAGAVGALGFAFSDSFWFYAVEGEVYAMSAFCTAFVVWAMLKWEPVEEEPDSDRWLILIAYAVGLSIGVHLLNLLAIPALGFIYYYRRRSTPLAGGIIVLVVGHHHVAVHSGGHHSGPADAGGLVRAVLCQLHRAAVLVGAVDFPGAVRRADLLRLPALVPHRASC